MTDATEVTFDNIVKRYESRRGPIPVQTTYCVTFIAEITRAAPHNSTYTLKVKSFPSEV